MHKVALINKCEDRISKCDLHPNDGHVVWKGSVNAHQSG